MWPVIFLVTPLWIFLWVIGATIISSTVAPFIRWQLDEDSFLQCFLANSTRIGLYFILFYGQMVIFRNLYLVNGQFSNSLFKRFSFYEQKMILVEGILALKTQLRSGWRKFLWITFQAASWLLYWYFLSFIILFMSGASHFMGDCDDTDLECGCQNMPYFLTAFGVTEILGLLMLLSLSALLKNGRQSLMR